MLTDFGKIIKILCTNANLKQEELAVELGISAPTLSNYMNGKTVPEMDILMKCIQHFNISNKDIKELLTKAFKSSSSNNKKIILNTEFLSEERLNLLIQALVILLCNTNNPGSSVYEKCPSNQGNDFFELKNAIDNCYKRLS